MTTLQYLQRILGVKEGAQAYLALHQRVCLLCGAPAERGVRCNVCRQTARFEHFLREPPVGERVAPVQHHRPTQEELDAIPF